MNKLKQKWSNFISMVLDPWFLVFVIATIISLGFSIAIKTNELFSNLLAVFGSITGGIAGGVFQNEYSQTTGENILRKKGQSAVRNLQSIQKQIGSLRCWVVNFAKKANNTIKPQLSEIDRHLSVIELNVNSGYEDWIDIDPTLRGEKEVQEKFNEAYRAFVVDLLDQKIKLAQSANASEQEELNKKIDQLEKQIKGMKKESGVILGNSVASIGGLRAFSLNQDNNISLSGSVLTASGPTCSQCGKKYNYDLTQPITIMGANFCPDCRK